MDNSQIQGVSSETQVDDFPTFADLDQYEDNQFDLPVSIICVCSIVLCLDYTDITTVYV